MAHTRPIFVFFKFLSHFRLGTSYKCVKYLGPELIMTSEVSISSPKHSIKTFSPVDRGYF